MTKKRLTVADIQALEAHYGWPRRELELAAAHAIHLAYVDQTMLAEADVNLTTGTLAVRRRNGNGAKGTWVDIAKPLMPTQRELEMVMDILQYGDGAPGRVVEGVVEEVLPTGIRYGLRGHRKVWVPESLLSVQDTFQKPALGTKQILMLTAGTHPETGDKLATRRGREFVAAVLELYHEGCVSGVWTGASNSWAVIRMAEPHVNVWLEKGAMNLKAMQALLGLKRITLLPEGKGNTPDERFENELKHFINNAWKECLVRRITPDEITIYTPVHDQNPKKIRTLTSMLHKIIPNRTIVVK